MSMKTSSDLSDYLGPKIRQKECYDRRGGGDLSYFLSNKGDIRSRQNLVDLQIVSRHLTKTNLMTIQ